MVEVTVTLSSIEDVKEFSTLANNCPFELDLVTGRYAVDAKSIMGIFSLDLSKPLKLCVRGNDAECKEFLEEAKKFITD